MVFSRDNLQPCIEGFEHINRYYDKTTGIFTAKILPGEYYVSRNAEVVTTVLGSCISACIRDPVVQVGGMNHFMLPIDRRTKPRDDDSVIDLSVAARYGDFAMEQLINVILKAGGKRKNLEVKVFGGGQVITQMTSSDVGTKNIDFVREYLEFEGLAIVAEDTGDIYPRKVKYYSDSGRVQIKKIISQHNDTIRTREANYYNSILKKPEAAEELELFS